jgi:imidazolonepropionase-like amidohydrolase
MLIPILLAAQAFTGARILEPAIENGTIIVRDGRIEQIGPAGRIKIPAGAEKIDVTGKTIVPGLINTHGHVGEAQGLRTGPELYTEENLQRQLALYARYGITTVFSLGGDRELGFKLRDSEPAGRARIYVAGAVIIGKTPEEATKMVDQVAAMKPNFIKIRYDDNLGTSTKMSPEVAKAIIDRAHHYKLPLAAHLFYLDDARYLLQSGADYIAHSIRDREVDAETIALLKKRDICVCPTLTREVSTFVYESRPAFFDDPFFLKEADKQVMDQLLDPKRQEAMRRSESAQRYKKALEMASRNLKKLSDSGVRIAFGTDTGPPARFQGYFEHMEMDLMSKAGLTPAQILKSATSDAAKCMNVAGKLGTLQKGAWADLVVLDSNPATDIKNMRSINSVWIAGKKIQR